MTLPEARWWSVPNFWGSPRDRTVDVNLWYLSTRVWWEYSMSNTITLYILSLVSARIEREHSSSHDNGSKMDRWDKKLPGICFTATNAPKLAHSYQLWWATKCLAQLLKSGRMSKRYCERPGKCALEARSAGRTSHCSVVYGACPWCGPSV